MMIRLTYASWKVSKALKKLTEAYLVIETSIWIYTSHIGENLSLQDA